MSFLSRCSWSTRLLGAGLAFASLPWFSAALASPPPISVPVERPLEVRLLALTAANFIKRENGEDIPPVSITRMKRGATVTEGDTVVFVPLFKFPRPDAQGVVSISCEITFLDPNGAVILHNVTRLCFNARPPVGAVGPFLTDQPIAMEADPADPLGVYTARVKITDNNSGATAIGTVVFTLDP